MISEKVEIEEAGEMLVAMFQVLELLYQDCQQQVPEENIDNESRPNEFYLTANPKNTKMGYSDR